MKKLILLALAIPAIVFAQSYPSPTFNSVILNNPLTPANGGTGATSSTGTGSVVLSGSPSISSPTITGSLTATGLVTLTSLATQAANTVIANVTGSSASPTAFAMPSCSASTSALLWTSGTGFGCATGHALTSATNIFSANQTIAASTASLTLNDTSGSNQTALYFQNSGSPVWSVKNASGATGAWVVNRYASGSVVDSPVSINNSTGLVTLADGAAITGGSINNATVGATTPSTGAFTTLAASSTVSGTGFSNYLASPPAIGGTAANTGAFTALSASGTVSGTGFANLLLPYAPLASPALTGTPSAPTAALGTNTSQIATMAAMVNHQGCKNILDFGGNNAGGGASANNAAWTADIAAQSTNSVCVYFPPGSYLFNAGLNYTIPNTASSITIAGDGSNQAVLIFPTSVNGITITTKDYTSSVHVRGLTLQTQGAGTANGLTITQGAGSISNEGNTAPSDICDVTFMGANGYTGTQYWNVGTDIHAVSNINYIKDYWLGALGAGTGTGTGLNISGTSATLASVVHNLIGSYFLFESTGLNLNTWVQGVTATATNFEEDNYGIWAGGTAGNVQLAITNSQFSTYSNDVVLAGPWTNVSMSNNLFYVGGSNSGVLVNNASAGDINIANNQFFPGFSASSPNGVYSNVNSASSNYLGENIFNSLGVGVTLTSNAPNWTLGPNSFSGVTTNYSIASQSENYTSYHTIGGTSFGTALPVSSTYYVSTAGANANLGQNLQVIAQAGALRNLTVQAYAAVGASQSWVATVYLNGSATAMTCTISGSSNALCQDLSHSVAVVAGSDITLGVTTSSGATVTGVVWSAMVVH